MKNFVISLLIICSKLNVGQIQASDKYYPNILTNNNPARFWVKAFPLGNGRLGAMVYGNPALEQIQMNENTIWTGGPYRNNNPKIAGSLNYLRELIFDDKFVEAEDLACKTMISEGSMGMPYQTAGNLYSAFAGHENFSDYHRELSLDNAIATTTYRVKSV